MMCIIISDMKIVMGQKFFVSQQFKELCQISQVIFDSSRIVPIEK